MQWHSYSGGGAPSDAVISSSGSTYVARKSDGGIYPGKLFSGAIWYVREGATALSSNTYDALGIGNHHVTWVPHTGSNPPPSNAVIGGQTLAGVILYVASQDGQCGYFDPVLAKAFTSRMGQKYEYSTFDILVCSSCTGLQCEYGLPTEAATS